MEKRFPIDLVMPMVWGAQNAHLGLLNFTVSSTEEDCTFKCLCILRSEEQTRPL